MKTKRKQAQPKNATSSNATSSKPPKPAATKPSKGNGGIGRVRGKNFSTDETMFLLKLVRDKLPSGGEDREWVTQQYNDVFGKKGRFRDKESLKRRFAALHNRRTPTGDPDCPDEVKEAKHLMIAIQQKCDAGKLYEDKDIGFSSSSSSSSSEDEEQEDDEADHDKKPAAEAKTPKTKLEIGAATTSLRSSTKKRRKKHHKNDKDILEYMSMSQAKRQENEDAEKAERREREQERREREQRRYEELQAEKASNRLRADQMQQQMIQMQH